MIPREWLKLESNIINKVKFIPNKHDLRGDVLIEFNEGKVYRYRDVPARKVENMIYSSSSGTYFHNNIRPFHQPEAVDA